MSSSGSSTSFTEIFTEASFSFTATMIVAAASFLVIGLASATRPGISESLIRSRAASFSSSSKSLALPKITAER